MLVNTKNTLKANDVFLAKSESDKITDSLRVRFLKSKEEMIEALFSKYKERAFVPFPDEVILSAAKVKAALTYYLQEMDYEHIPTNEDLKDITGGMITDEDFLNERLVQDDYLSLDDVIDEEGNIYDRDIETDMDVISRDETIDDGSYDREQFMDSMYESLYRLVPEERELLMCKFGLGEYEEMDEDALSNHFRISKKDVETRTESALSHMRDLMWTMM